MEIKKKIYRLLFLLIISNGGVVLLVFYYNQTKFIVCLILLFIIKRELHFDMKEKNKDYNYYLINFNLFMFAISMAPYLIFLLLIYIFHDIQYNNLIKKESVKKYVIVILIFLIQNFYFVIYPSLFFDFIESRGTSKLFYMEGIFSIENLNILVFSIIGMCIISILIISKKTMNIIRKFGYFSFFSIFISFYAHRSLAILIPLTLLLYIPFLNENDRIVQFINDNKILLLGLISIYSIYHWIYRESIFRYFPFMENFPFVILVDLRWIILLAIMASSLFILEFKKKRINL